MVTKRIRSEYMKKFKNPKWETYGKCYENLVSYRLSRRMLEQSHKPWFWDESGSDTESSGKCSPKESPTDCRLQKKGKAPRAKETTETEANRAEVFIAPREPDMSQITGGKMSKS